MNTLTRENRDGDRAQAEQFIAPPASVIEAGDGYTLDGHKMFVIDGHTADVILVAAKTDKGVSLFQVTGDASGLTRTPLSTMDQTRKQARLDFSAVRARRIGHPGEGWPALSKTLDQAAVALTNEMVGSGERALEMAAKAASMQDAAHDFKSEGFFEYHLYTLDGRTTLKDNQTKQLTLMSAGDVPVVKELIYYGAQDYYRTSYGMPMSNQKVGVYLDIKNATEHRLGVPLPKGKVRVYKADASGSQQFVGEDWIDHTPKDERVKIKMGEAFDLVGERTQKDFRKIGVNLYEVEWEISLRNHKTTAQTVTVIEPVPGDWQVLAATHAWEKPEAHTLKFQIPVAKEGASKLAYRVRVKF